MPDKSAEGRLMLALGDKPEQVYNLHAKHIEMANLGQEFIDKVNTAPLILFTQAKAEAALDWDKDRFTESFRMPFQACTVVDGVSAVSFLDSTYITPHQEPDLFDHLWQNLDGWTVDDVRSNVPRKWVGPLPGEAIGVTVVLSMASVKGISILHLVGGSVVVNPTGKFRTFCLATHLVILFKDGSVFKIYEDKSQPIPPELTRDATTNTLTALGQLGYLSQSQDYVVEVTPRKTRPPEKAKKIIRLHERPRVVLLDPDEIRTIRPPQDGTHASPVPHTRRGHKRTYKHPRYKNMVGKTVWIDQIDVKGGESWKFGNKTYMVMDKTEEKPDAENNEARN